MGTEALAQPATSAMPDGFATLVGAYPWPASRPFPDAPVRGRNSSGFDLLTETIAARRRPTVVMEIGAEFGGSTRKFAAVPDTWIVSVDPWPDSYGGGSFPELQPYLGGEAAMYQLFQSLCWPHRDRLVAVREPSPAGFKTVYDAGVPVDVIYIDGDHRYDAVIRDLTVADALFPGALLTGDDWKLKSGHVKYEGMQIPVQRAVTSWAAFHDHHVEVRANTWMIDKTRPYNLEQPPARFVDNGSVLAELDRRMRKIEAAVSTPSFAARVERKLRKLAKR